jgi:hypothetical protein
VIDAEWMDGADQAWGWEEDYRYEPACAVGDDVDKAPGGVVFKLLSRLGANSGVRIAQSTNGTALEETNSGPILVRSAYQKPLNRVGRLSCALGRSS